MNKPVLFIAICCIIHFTAVGAHADLADFITDLNLRAKADLDGFTANVSVQFGVPIPQVKVILAEMPTPADTFLCFQLGSMAGKPVDAVLTAYRLHKGKGWGVIALELGLKPGSAEFHALKGGNFALTGKPAGKAADDHGPHKDKEKGKGKGKH